MAMSKCSSVILNRLADLVTRNDCADWLVATAKSLGYRDHVGNDAVLLVRIERAATAAATHHLVGNE